MIDKGQWGEFGQDTGVKPLLFTRSAMGFLMTTESQDLGLTSHPKDGMSWEEARCSPYQQHYTLNKDKKNEITINHTFKLNIVVYFLHIFV